MGGRLLEPAPEDSTSADRHWPDRPLPPGRDPDGGASGGGDTAPGPDGLLAALEERGTLEKVSSIDLSAGTEILLRYDGRFDVKLPISGDFIHKLRALEAVVEKRESYETGTMDLTRQDYDVVFSPG